MQQQVSIRCLRRVIEILRPWLLRPSLWRWLHPEHLILILAINISWSRLLIQILRIIFVKKGIILYKQLIVHISLFVFKFARILVLFDLPLHRVHHFKAFIQFLSLFCAWWPCHLRREAEHLSYLRIMLLLLSTSGSWSLWTLRIIYITAICFSFSWLSLVSHWMVDLLILSTTCFLKSYFNFTLLR